MNQQRKKNKALRKRALTRIAFDRASGFGNSMVHHLTLPDTTPSQTLYWSWFKAMTKPNEPTGNGCWEKPAQGQEPSTFPNSGAQPRWIARSALNGTWWLSGIIARFRSFLMCFCRIKIPKPEPTWGLIDPSNGGSQFKQDSTPCRDGSWYTATFLIG